MAAGPGNLARRGAKFAGSSTRRGVWCAAGLGLGGGFGTGSGLGASGLAGGRGGGTTAAVCCGFSAGFVSVGGASAGAGVSAACGASPFGRSTSFACGSPRSSDARRPRGGGGTGFGRGCGGGGLASGAGGGGSTTSCTVTGSVSAGGDICQSISNSKGNKCNKREPTGPRSLLHRRRSPIGKLRASGSGGCGPSSRPPGPAAGRPEDRLRPGSIHPWAPASAGVTRPIVGSYLSPSEHATVSPKAGSRRASSDDPVMRNTASHHPAVSPASVSQAASSSSLTPRAAAFVAFEPGSAPATT